VQVMTITYITHNCFRCPVCPSCFSHAAHTAAAENKEHRNVIVDSGLERKKSLIFSLDLPGGVC